MFLNEFYTSSVGPIDRAEHLNFILTWKNETQICELFHWKKPSFYIYGYPKNTLVKCNKNNKGEDTSSNDSKNIIFGTRLKFKIITKDWFLICFRVIFKCTWYTSGKKLIKIKNYLKAKLQSNFRKLAN